ncbi:MAG: c-type cytochrome [Planctomycetaceae bacterium]
MCDRITWALVSGITLAAIAGCAPGPTSGKGFTLPKGNIEEGQAAFISLKCHACHSVAGIELPEITAELNPRVQLGGEVPRINTYGELVTSIINPSHKLAQGYPAEAVSRDGASRMTNYNHALTVQQLIDLVAFLQSRYKLEPYVPTEYPPIY